MSTCPEHLPVTPDGRYFVHGGRLWRCSNPDLPEAERERLVAELMDARRAVGTAKRQGDEEAERVARTQVHATKVALGERGPVWWGDDEGETWDRYAPENTPYAEWWAGLTEESKGV